MPRAKPRPEAPQAAPQQKVMSEAERLARARGFKGNQELREQFGIDDDHPRELVRVDILPDPPATETIETAARKRTQPVETVNIDEAVMTIFREEAEEIAVRLERFGIPFTPSMRQDMVDHLFALLALNQQGMAVGGGARARR